MSASVGLAGVIEAEVRLGAEFTTVTLLEVAALPYSVPSCGVAVTSTTWPLSK